MPYRWDSIARTGLLHFVHCSVCHMGYGLLVVWLLHSWDSSSMSHSWDSIWDFLSGHGRSRAPAPQGIPAPCHLLHLRGVPTGASCTGTHNSSFLCFFFINQWAANCLLSVHSFILCSTHAYHSPGTMTMHAASNGILRHSSLAHSCNTALCFNCTPVIGVAPR